MALARGSIHVIFGPMFSGKTTELLRRMKRHLVAQQSCLLIKYAKDVRYSTNGISTHDRSVAALHLTPDKNQMREHAPS